MASRSEIAALLASQGGQFSPVKKRGYLLPIGQNQKGKTVPAVPQFVYDIGAALAAPGKVMRNPGLMINPETGRTSDYAINRSADLAGMMTLGSGAIPAQPNSLRMGIKAYHGSPHDFDRFSMDKIGTGEGAQAYGHGLYFAENEGVAKSYRDALTQGLDSWSVDGVPAGRLNGSTNVEDRTKLQIAKAVREGQSVNEAIDWVQKQYAGKAKSRFEFPENIAFFNDEIARLESMKAAPPKIEYNPGSMYEVNIDANPDDFLDWDRPLSEQGPKVQSAFKDVPQAPDIPGQLAVYRLGDKKLNNPEASRKMMEAGIPGIKYLDAGSRVYDATADGMVKNYGTREKALEVAQKRLSTAHYSDRAAWEKTVQSLSAPETRNYVVFDDKLISIVKKYGVAALVAAGVLDQVQGEELKARGYN